MVHKSLELLGLCKLTQQKGLKTFEDDATGIWKVSQVTPKRAAEHSIAYYEANKSFIWTPKDREECIDLVNKAIEFNNGEFDPRKANVVNLEFGFDFEVEDEWSNYEFEYKGEILKGKLRLKGTIDFLESPIDGTIHIVDYKTSANRNVWPTKKLKDYEYLKNEDIQLRLYHYAITKALPQYENVLITIFFIRLGEAFTIAYEPEDIIKTKAMIRENFEKAVAITRPKLNRGFWCERLCAYGKNKQKGSDLTVCEFMKKEIYQIGIQAVTEKHSNGNFNYYSAPGA